MPVKVVTPSWIIENNEFFRVRTPNSEEMIVDKKGLAKLLSKYDGLWLSVCADCDGTVVRVTWAAPSRYKYDLEMGAKLALYDDLDGVNLSRVSLDKEEIVIIRGIECRNNLPTYAEYIFIPRKLNEDEIKFLMQVIPLSARSDFSLHDAKEPLVPYVNGLWTYLLKILAEKTG